MEIMRCYFVLVLVLVLVIITSCQHSSVDVLVDTPTGVIRGHVLETWTKNKYYAFKGIPYAEPPIGKLRFKAPVRVKSWEGIKDATKDGKICPQADPKFVGGTVNEDCLYLNVYSKNLLGSLPVIVFIHPGGFRFMTGASTWYGPDYLLDHDIVFVTFNYRLDALGFLSTGDKLATGNFGMKDQVEVLKWVQKNIIHFGGNPHQVTITGDSSGAASVFLHMLSPMSRGLFHKAVAMSGGIVGTIKWLTSKQQIVITEKLAKDFNCPIKPANDMVECLRNIPADEINSKFRETEELGPRVALNFGPVIESEGVDGEERFLLDHPSTLFKNKLFNHVPVVTGITEYELVRKAVGIAKNKTLVEKLNNEFDTIAPILFEYDDKTLEEKKKLNNALRKFYFGNHTINNASSEVLGQMFSDYMINYGEYATVNLLSKYSDESVYFYKFSYQGRYGHEYDPVTNKTLGPGHINDLMYLFYASKLFPKFKESDKEAFMVKMQTSIWYNFASNGNPTPSGSPIEWTPVTEKTKKYINIDSLLTMEDGLPFPERMKLWESLYPV